MSVKKYIAFVDSVTTHGSDIGGRIGATISATYIPAAGKLPDPSSWAAYRLCEDGWLHPADSTLKKWQIAMLPEERAFYLVTAGAPAYVDQWDCCIIPTAAVRFIEPNEEGNRLQRRAAWLNQAMQQ